jgi:hypothetical protein
MSVKPSTYRKAAERLFEGKNKLACLAIADQFRNSDSIAKTPSVQLFSSYFRPGVTFPYDNWFGDINHPQNQEARMLALLFMEQILK